MSYIDTATGGVISDTVGSSCDEAYRLAYSYSETLSRDIGAAGSSAGVEIPLPNPYTPAVND